MPAIPPHIFPCDDEIADEELSSDDDSELASRRITSVTRRSVPLPSAAACALPRISTRFPSYFMRSRLSSVDSKRRICPSESVRVCVPSDEALNASFSSVPTYRTFGVETTGVELSDPSIDADDVSESPPDVSPAGEQAETAAKKESAMAKGMKLFEVMKRGVRAQYSAFF